MPLFGKCIEVTAYSDFGDMKPSAEIAEAYEISGSDDGQDLFAPHFGWDFTITSLYVHCSLAYLRAERSNIVLHNATFTQSRATSGSCICFRFRNVANR